MTIFGDNFPTIFDDNLKNTVIKFTPKKLRLELSSFFYIMSDSEEGNILEEEWKKNKILGTGIFLQKRRKSSIQKFNKKIELADRSSVLVQV